MLCYAQRERERVDEKQQIAIAVVHKRTTQSKDAPDSAWVSTVTR